MRGWSGMHHVGDQINPLCKRSVAKFAVGNFDASLPGEDGLGWPYYLYKSYGNLGVWGLI